MQRKDSFLLDDDERSERADAAFWQALGRLYRWRRFIAGITLTMAIASVAISLMLPNSYRASARLLLPDSNSGGIPAVLLKNLPSAASSLLGSGGGGDVIRYLAILHSRTVLEAAVDTFDLVRVYGLEDSEAPRVEALAVLEDNVSFELDQEYEFLSVSAADADPQRAADMANFFVRRLNGVNARLSAQSAGNYRHFVQKRYLEARAAMDSVLHATQLFQQKYGIYDLPAQTEAFLEQVALMRSSTLEAEIQHQVLLDQYGPENARVETARKAVEAANQQYQQAMAGRELLFPVAQTEMPNVARQYVDLEMERMIQATILEVIAPMYEQARFEEEKKVEAVQVLDHAVPPVKKAGPKRTIIVIASTLSAFLLAVVFVLLCEWWRSNSMYVARRIREAAGAVPSKKETTTLS